MNKTITLTTDDAREIYALLKSCNLDGLRGATLAAACDLIREKIATAATSGEPLTLRKVEND